MPKVVNPLGSAEARGRVGRLLVFQGTTVKRWAAPKINKVSAQLAAEDRFRDINKTLRALKGWGRGAFESLFGRNWMAYGYQGIVGYWEQNAAAYDELSSGEKQDWLEYAPVQATKNPAGLVFYACAQGLYQFLYGNGYFGYEFFEVGEVNAAGSRAWWDQELTGVFVPGIYDQTNPDIHGLTDFFGWSLVSDALAYGGNYRQSTASGMDIFTFWFLGGAFGVIYKQTSSLGGLKVELDYGTVWTIYQNSPQGAYQVEWRSPKVTKGLHRVIGFRTGAVGSVNVDGIVVYG